MSGERFDELTKELGNGTTRRGFLKKLLLGAGGAVAAGGGAAAVSAAGPKCFGPGEKCETNQQCCSSNCAPTKRGRICGCPLNAGQELICTGPSAKSCGCFCTKNSCTGCCVGSNTGNCQQVPTNLLCGTGAAICVTCNVQNCEVCDPAQGKCVSSCTAQETCIGGACCPNTRVCGNTCLATACDATNCEVCDPAQGKCVSSCTAQETCIGGACCPNTRVCGNTCLATACDATNCQVCDPTSGTCVSACPPGQTCVSGSCVTICGSGNCSGCCAAGNVCQPGNTDLVCGSGGGTCVACTPPNVCCGGRCKLPTGESCNGNGECCSNRCAAAVRGGPKTCA